MNQIARNAVIALGITALIFGTGFWAANSINSLRLDEIRNIEEGIGTDTLSLETQFDLLANLSCSQIAENPVSSSELGSLGDRLAYTEEKLGSNNAEVLALKRQYSLLEIKDYLLGQKVAERCNTKPVTVLYFYSNAGDCPTCENAGRTLTYLRQTYPDLRVYSFDYDLDVGALKTLITVTKVTDTLPAFIIGSKTYYNLSTVADLQKVLPLDKLTVSTSTATSTKKK